MSAMKRMPGSDKPGKSNKPDGTPDRGRAGKGKPFDRPASRKPGTGKYGKDNEGQDSTPERSFKGRKPFERKDESTGKPRRFSKPGEDQPRRTYKKDDSTERPRERRFSDKPSEDRPRKFSKPGEDQPRRTFKKDDSTDRPRERRFSDKPSEDRPRKFSKPGEDQPRRTYKKDDSTDSPREKRFGDKPSGDRPYKSRKPYGAASEDGSTSRPFKGKRDDKPSFHKKREGDTETSYNKRYSDKPEGDRPYRSRRPSENPDSETNTTRTYRGGNYDKPARPRKRKDGEDETTGADTGDFRPKRRFTDKPEGSFRKGKPGGSPLPKGNKGFGSDGTIRLNKYIANSGVCSRREADILIESGAVTVNGVVVTELGVKVTRDDKIQFGGETLNLEKKVYLLLNKPKGYITTVDDPQERNTVMMLVKDACNERIYPVGRLDRNTTGLLLFTNDGEVAKKLTHPGHKVRKVYHVELNKGLAKSDMIQLTDGIELEDGMMAVDEIAYTGSADDKKNIGVVIHSGRNRVVRRLFEALDYEVVKLDRVAFANLTKKDLPRGRWRMLEQSEINMLLML